MTRPKFSPSVSQTTGIDTRSSRVNPIYAQVASPASLALDVNNAGNMPLYRHLAQQLRHMVSSGTLAAGTRLPTTRSLAEELHINRGVVVDAFSELRAEGIFEGLHRAGTFVAAVARGPSESVRIALEQRRWTTRLSQPSTSRIAGCWDLRLGQTTLLELPVEV